VIVLDTHVWIWWVHGDPQLPALNSPGTRLLELTPQIAVESTQLPGTFQRDPADQIIVATARIYNCPIVTLDERILAYPHVQKKP